jgi:cellulose synthase operon protein C
MRRRRLAARTAGACIVCASLVCSAPVLGFTWPDAVDRADRDLSSPDPSVRRAAAERLQTLAPVVATPLVLRALGDADVDVRISAAHAAMAKRVAPAEHVALGWLGDREARLRSAACEVIGALPDPEAVAPLARALGDAEVSVRTAAASALGKQVPALAVPPLLGKLDDASPVVRVEVVRALARLADRRSVVPLVGKAEDAVPEVRKEVARALGELGDLRAAPALVLQLRDGSGDVKAAALHALGQLRVEGAADVIAPLASDRSPILRRAAIEALGRIGSAEAVRALVSLLGTGDDATAGLETSSAREALVSAGTRAVAPLEARLFGPSTPAIATSTAWVLGELQATSAIPDIVRAMRQGTLPVTGALRALSSMGSPEAVSVVLEFVDDPSSATRKEAIGAAASLLDPEHPDGRAVEPLAAALRDPALTTSERARVAALLGRTRALRAAPNLEALLSAKDLELRLAAIDALGTLHPTRVAGSLLAAIEDSDPSIRLHAAIALGRCGGDAARDGLVARLQRDSEVDRAATLTALGGILSRVPSDASVLALSRELGFSEGPSRDALILAIGRADIPLAFGTLVTQAQSSNADDRRAVAAVLAARRATPASLEMLGMLLLDPDPSVRSEAAWSLGEVGGLASLGALGATIGSPDLGPATNATAAMARVLARAHASDSAAASELCPLLRDARSYVRADAAAGLALVAARCGDGAVERSLLESDVAPVRVAAARAIAQHPLGTEDARALERCRTSDPSGAVARRCRGGPAPAPSGSEPVELYIEDDLGVAPRPGAPYVAELADGLLRMGRADRRGAAFDAGAPHGDVSLLRATTSNR